MAKERPPLDSESLVLIWQDVCRTARWAIVGLSIVACMGIVTYGAVQIATDDKEWYEIVIIALTGPVTVLGISVALLKKRLIPIIKRFAPRLARLEQSVDPNRTSSQVSPDGTLPDD